MGHYLRHTTLSDKHGGGSIMAWVCVAADGSSRILKYTGLYTLLILQML